MLEELIQLDREAFLFLNNLGNTGWDGFWLFLSNKWYAIPLYLLLLILCYKTLGLKKTLVLLVTIALMITTTDQLANFFKYGVQRLRPCLDNDLSELVRLVKSSCGGKYGFYSAHASNTMAIAYFFAVLLKPKFKYLGWVLFVWAIFVAYSRVYLGVHFPLDILMGMAMGLLLSWVFYKLYTLVIHKFQL
jgi:undecaprenyl-diphosphatase